jgi:haloacetate dehalogenase
MWHLVAPRLAEDFTVIATDLRGYGDSSKSEGGEGHAKYSKRAMALDQVEVMKHFGFERFALCGHDRGGRVGYCIALDNPGVVTKLAVLDTCRRGRRSAGPTWRSASATGTGFS